MVFSLQIITRKIAVNFSLFDEERLHDLTGHMCNSTWTQAGWNKAGFTKFEKVRLKFSSSEGIPSVVIDRLDTTYTTHNSLGGSDKPKYFGTAGDCYSWNECPEARRGTFNINLGNKAEVDWKKTGEWEADAWGNGNFMVDYEKTGNSVSARCGGWCGECKPTTDIFLAPARNG